MPRLNKKTIWISIAIIVAILAVYIFYAPAAGAQVKAPTAPKSGVGGGLAITTAVKDAAIWAALIFFILNLVLEVLGWLYGAAGVILNQAFFFATQSGWFVNDAITKGWSLFRDLANIWIVLSLLVIAVLTILRLESFSTKKTLTQLIVVAMLINFSLPMARAIIDVGNVITFQFVQKMGKPQPGIGTYDVSASIENGLGAVNAIKESSTASAILTGAVSAGLESAGAITLSTALALGGWAGGAGLCTAGGVTLFIATICGAVGSAAATVVGNWISSALTGTSLIFGAIKPYVDLIITILLMLFAVYVVLALAFFLLARTAVLMLLLVLSPAAFAFSIFPQTSHISKEWWSKFINQVFFAPAVAAMLWVAINLMNQSKTSFFTFNPAHSLLDLHNGKLVFFFLFGFMLYACLLFARKMGAVGAETAMTWFGKARSWITGAVGGAALVSTVGRLGGALQKVPAVQQSVFGSGIARMMTRAGARFPFGSYEDIQKTQAEIAMRKAEPQWAGDFMKLGTPGRVAMLGAMNEKQKDDLRDNLKQLSPDAGEQMFENAMRLHFGEAALAKTDLEGWKKSAPDIQKNLAPYSDEVIEQILRSFPDDDARAKWMLGLTPDNRNKAMGAMNARFGTAEKTKYNKAERRQEMRNAELGVGGANFDSLVGGFGEDKDSDYLDSADDRQKLLWLEGVSKITDPIARAAKLQRYQEIIRSKLSPEDQEKFHRETLRRASMPAISSYINTLPDVASKEKVIGSASSAQQAQLWISDKPLRGTVDTAVGKQSADTQRDFHAALGREVDRKTADGIADVFGELSKDTQILVARGNLDRNTEIINSLHKAGKSADAVEFARHIKDAGLAAQYVKKLNPIYKVQYMDGIDPTARPADFEASVAKEIKNSPARELAAKLSADILANKQLREALLKKGSLTQFATLAADTPNKQAIVKEMLTMDDAGNALSPGAILNNIKAKNKELGAQIEALRKKQAQSLMPVVREFLAAIFGEK